MATLLSMTSSSSRGRLRHRHGGRRRPTFSVEEEHPVGHLVGHVVTSQAGGDGRSFSLLATHSRDIDDVEKLTSNRSLFAVDSETGSVRTAVVLDREELCATSLRTRTRTGTQPPSCVVSLDVAILPRFDVVVVDIEIVDINDHAPSFGGVITITRHVTESASPGPAVFQLPVAVDQDGGGDNGAVEYQLLPVTSPFRLVVDQQTEQLDVELVEPLDRETTSVHVYILMVNSIFSSASFLTNISHSLTKSLHSPNLAILTFVNFAASVLILIAKRPVSLQPP